MPQPSGDTCLQVCPNCAALVDIRDQEPLAKFHCPTCGTAMRASRQYNHFSIIESLGQGGMGTVYKAMDRNLNRMVALKLLRKELSSDDGYIAKLEDEARITASINHPYVVKVFSFGSDHGQYYIAMELVDKGSLDDLMQLQVRVSELQVLQVGLQVASGLQAAFQAGLIHRDVKPGNILFADAHTAKITDFGLALLAEQEADSRGEIWGTPYYIAPEKLNNQPEDFRSDIYSLGGTLFHAVAGRPPFEAESASLVALKHLKSKAVSLQAFAPDVSSETAYVINRMLHKDPGERYASYGELIDHFKYAIDTLTANLNKPRAAKERVVVESESQSNIAGILTLLLLVILAVGALFAWLYRDRFFGAGGNSAASAQVNPGTATADNKPTADAAYEEARHQIFAGQYADAEASFAGLLQRTDLTQPTLNWARLHQGLAALLNDELSDARADFGRLKAAGQFTTDANQAQLANFFPEIGRYLADEKTIPASVTKLWDKNTFENMGLLLFGLKDWSLGNFNDANALLEAYLAGRPPASYGWIADYSPIARKCVHDYALWAPLQARRKAGGFNSDELKQDFTRARAQLQSSGRMVEAFFSTEAELGAGAPPSGIANPSPSPLKPAATPSPASSAPAPSSTSTPAAIVAPIPPTPPAPVAPTPAPVIVEHEQDRIRWQTARESYAQQVALFHFDEAVSVLAHVNLTDPAFVQARNLLLVRARNLIAFKKTLTNDVNASNGYPKPVASRRGITFPRGLQRINAETADALTPYGVISVPLTDFSPQALLAIAQYFIDATVDPAQAATRQWLAANFALETGQTNLARVLAVAAARDQPAYQKQLGPFTGLADPVAPLPPSLRAP